MGGFVGRAVGLGFLGSMAALPAASQTAATAADFRPLPYAEDFSRLSETGGRAGLWERLKYIPVGENGRLTLGGELRSRVEYRDHYNYGRGVEDEGFNSQVRTRLWADLRLSSSVRIFGELRHSHSAGQNEVVLGPVDSNGFEVHQAFVEASGALGGGSAGLRVGRQEVLLGRGRIFDIRDGTNTRRGFDAIRLHGETGEWRYGALGGAIVREVLRDFNDETNSDWRFAAAHAARGFGASGSGGEVETIYIYTDRDVAPNPAFVGRRHTVSVRLGGREGPWEYDIEVVGQSGETDDGRDIRAWFIGSDGAYHLTGAWSPRVGWRADIGSGDTDAGDGHAGAYDALWTRAQSFVPELGYPNMTAVGPAVWLRPNPKLSLEALVQGLWRTTRNDGVYTLSGAYQRRVDEGQSRYVGLRGIVRGEYRHNPHVAVGFYVNNTFVGDFLRESGSAEDLRYATIYTTLRF